MESTAFARDAGGFDGQRNRARPLRPRQPRHLTYAVFAIRAAANQALDTEVVVQIITVNFRYVLTTYRAAVV